MFSCTNITRFRTETQQILRLPIEMSVIDRTNLANKDNCEVKRIQDRIF